MTQSKMSGTQRELLYYWALGDLHYRALKPWHECHRNRMDIMFTDLHTLWQTEDTEDTEDTEATEAPEDREGRPAFCVSPGDIIETCAQENYAIAKNELKTQLADLPFYPGIGNHEYYGLAGEEPRGMAETFSRMWEKPIRYAWEAGKDGEVGCIMLDYPNPFTLEKPEMVYLSSDTLAFLDTMLGEYKGRPVIIFLHCPLSNTVLDRDPEKHRDFNSRQHFFAPENSQEVRTILADRGNACLFIGGHTHSGWEAPNLVVTEQIGEQPVTFVNLMSPWYTGRQRGPQLSDDHTNFTYRADEPDVIPSFAFRIYSDHATIRVREHSTRTWLKEWNVPVGPIRS